MIPLLRDKCLNISSHSPIWHYTFQWTLTHAPLAHWAIIGCHLVSPVVAPAYLEQCMHGLVNHRMSDKPNFFDGKASLAAKLGVPKNLLQVILDEGVVARFWLEKCQGALDFNIHFYSFIFICIFTYILLLLPWLSYHVLSLQILQLVPRCRNGYGSEPGPKRQRDPGTPGILVP